MVRIENRLPRRIADGMRKALPIGPRNRLLRCPVILENGCPIVKPEQERYQLAVLQQLTIGAEKLREKILKMIVLFAEERFRTKLERSAPVERIGGKRYGRIRQGLHTFDCSTDIHCPQTPSKMQSRQTHPNKPLQIFENHVRSHAHSLNRAPRE